MDKFMDFWIKRIGFWGACAVTAVFMAIFGIGGIVCVIVGRIFWRIRKALMLYRTGGYWKELKQLKLRSEPEMYYL